MRCADILGFGPLQMASINGFCYKEYFRDRILLNIWLPTSIKKFRNDCGFSWGIAWAQTFYIQNQIRVNYVVGH